MQLTQLNRDGSSQDCTDDSVQEVRQFQSSLLLFTLQCNFLQYRMYKFNDNKSEAIQGRFWDMKTAGEYYFLLTGKVDCLLEMCKTSRVKTSMSYQVSNPVFLRDLF